MYERIAQYPNTSTTDQVVWMEPWCEEVTIPPGKTFQFKGNSVFEGDIQIETFHRGIIVYGWPGSLISVESDGQVVWEAYMRLPPVPLADDDQKRQ